MKIVTNSGHYSEVDEEWRKFYAIISLYKAYRIANCEQNLVEFFKPFLVKEYC